MYAVFLMAAVAAPSCGGFGCGEGFGGGTYAHGYGQRFPTVHFGCGVGLPPAWACEGEMAEVQCWFDYVNLLEGDEKAEMICLWEQATPEARLKLVAKLPALAAAAAANREQVALERAIARYKEENRPLTEEELEVWNAYIVQLSGPTRKVALAMWKGTDNRGRRLLLKDLIRRQEMEEEMEEGK